MSDKDVTLDDIKRRTRKFCEDRDWDQYHGPKDLSMAIINEASELLEIFKYQTDAQIKTLFNDPKSREAIEDEVADVLFGLARFAQMNGIDISRAFDKKIRKTALKYPIKLAKGKNQKYTKYAGSR